ncbi:unnamed protein product [Gordionus sp. m RMFG-2023]
MFTVSLPRNIIRFLFYTLPLIGGINSWRPFYSKTNEEILGPFNVVRSVATRRDSVELSGDIYFNKSSSRGNYLRILGDTQKRHSIPFTAKYDNRGNYDDKILLIAEEDIGSRARDSRIRNILSEFKLAVDIQNLAKPDDSILPSVITQHVNPVDLNDVLEKSDKPIRSISKRDTRQLKEENYNTGFNTFWNIPTNLCREKMGIELPLSSYGIIANEEQKFFGSKINIFYLNNGLWPHYEEGDPSSKIAPNILFLNELNNQESHLLEINHGIPQIGNLDNHLSLFRKSVENIIPDPNYDGLAVIDFEEYQPSLKVTEGKFRDVYKQKSYEYALQRFPGRENDPELKEISENLFNSAARLFFESTLKLGIQMRPNAKWGYYGFPYCYRIELGILDCSERMSTMNNENMWLYEASTALFPSIYLYNKPLPEPIDTGIWIHKIFREVNRLRNKLRYKHLPTFPYFRFEYPAEEGERYEKYLQVKDLKFSYKQALEMGMNGMIIWASSQRLVDKCLNISQYLKNYLGPISNMSKVFAEVCRNTICRKNPLQSPMFGNYATRSLNNQANEDRCVKIDSENMEYIYNILKTSHYLDSYPERYEDIESQYRCVRV